MNFDEAVPSPEDSDRPRADVPRVGAQGIGKKKWNCRRVLRRRGFQRRPGDAVVANPGWRVHSPRPHSCSEP